MEQLRNASFAKTTQWVLGIHHQVLEHITAGLEYVFIDQHSDENANRSGLFYRALNNVNIARFDMVANL